MITTWPTYIQQMIRPQLIKYAMKSALHHCRVFAFLISLTASLQTFWRCGGNLELRKPSVSPQSCNGTSKGGSAEIKGKKLVSPMFGPIEVYIYLFFSYNPKTTVQVVCSAIEIHLMNRSHKIGAASLELWWGSYSLLLLSNLVGTRWNTLFLHSAEMLQSWDHRLPHTTLWDISTDTDAQEVIMCRSVLDRLARINLRCTFTLLPEKRACD